MGLLKLTNVSLEQIDELLCSLNEKEIKLLREILVPTATDYKGMYIGILLAISIILFAITQIVDICKERKLKEKEN